MKTGNPGRREDAGRPRVAVVMSGYGVVRRGAETMLAEILPRLEDRFEFHVFSRSGRDPGGVRRPAIPRSAVERLYMATTLGRKLLDTLFLDPIHVEWTSHLLLSLPALVRGRYRLIWHESGLWGGRILGLVRRLTGVRLFDFAHSSDPNWELRFARLRPDAVATANPDLADFLKQQVDGLRVEVVPPGVDCTRFHPDAAPADLGVERPSGLVVGSLTPDKQPEIALEALSLAGIGAVVVGAGPLGEALDAAAERMFPPGRYRRIAVRRDEMPGVYTAADLVVLSSPQEGGPITAVEAMACGRPMVTTDDPVRRLIVGDGGVLVADPTPLAFARAVREALDTDWNGRPRAQAELFSIERQVRALGDLLAELTGSAGKGRA
ncbi:MAG: glycosyltransferase family 4 protein [Thermoanaerobaculia bacterium]|nr:glycosyltransferase family 4 protein [Thermoanaerobaculia bacterium]